MRLASLGADPFSRGSSTYLPVGATTKDIATLSFPVSPRLVLCGEHTSVDNYGTALGALESGGE